MWFNNAVIYQYKLDQDLDFNVVFAEEILKPCPPHARYSLGWVFPYGENLVQEVLGASLFCLGKEERVLPRGVIKQFLQEKIRQLELEQARKIKAAEKSQMAEDLEFDLLPKAFCLQKQTFGLFLKQSNYLILNTASPNQSLPVLSLLRKCIPNIDIQPVSIDHSLPLLFARWINHAASIPPGFQLASNCVLFSLEDEKKQVNCKGYELPAEEILTLLAQGLAAAEISLIWQERIQFTLTHELVLKRIKCLDYLQNDIKEIQTMEENAQEDAQLALIAGELHQLIRELLQGLMVQAQAPQSALA